MLLIHACFCYTFMTNSSSKPPLNEQIRSASEDRFSALITATSDIIYSLSADWRVMRELDGRGFLKDTHAPTTDWQSRNIPAEELSNHLSSLEKNDTIICVCNHGKERSQQAAEMLYASGFENTFYLTGGTAAWLDE